MKKGENGIDLKTIGLVLGALIIIVLVLSNNNQLGSVFNILGSSASPKTRHFVSISNPTNYNTDDIIRLGTWGIDVQNWATIYGGKMTPWRDGNGNYELKDDQKDLIKELYGDGQRIFWMGVTGEHINIFGTPQVYTETAKGIAAFVDAFNEMNMPEAYVGVYVPAFGQDEPITQIKSGNTRQQQYDFSEAVRAAVKTASGANWSKVMWMITGQDNYMGFQLTNDAQSYWAHHTDVSSTSDVEDLVYNDDYSIMSDPEWKAIWGGFKKLAWTDTGLITGSVGSRYPTALGLDVYLK